MEGTWSLFASTVPENDCEISNRLDREVEKPAARLDWVNEGVQALGLRMVWTKSPSSGECPPWRTVSIVVRAWPYGAIMPGSRWKARIQLAQSLMYPLNPLRRTIRCLRTHQKSAVE